MLLIFSQISKKNMLKWKEEFLKDKEKTHHRKPEAYQNSKRSREKYQKSTEGLSTRRRNWLTESTGKQMKGDKHGAAVTLEAKQSP